MRTESASAVLLTLGLLPASIAAQQLVTNLRPTQTGGGGSGAELRDIAVVGSIGFASMDSPWGIELLVTDGTPANTRPLLDLSLPGLGPGRSDPDSLTVLGSNLVFTAIVGGLGREPWVTDGTAAGTRILADIQPGDSSSDSTDFVVYGNAAYFRTRAPGTGTGIWVTDGTPGGTGPFAGLPPSSATSQIRPLGVSNGLLYIGGSGGLWITDGTVTGTQRIVDPASTGLDDFSAGVSFGNGMLFRARVASAGFEPVYSDGTAIGTVALRDINPGQSSSFAGSFTPVSAQRALFFAFSPGIGGRLWSTDGTPGGTQLYDEGIPGFTVSSVADLVTLGGEVYFRAATPATGEELWRTDLARGTAVLVADLGPGTSGSGPTSITRVGSEIWFAARTSSMNQAGLFSVDANGVAQQRAYQPLRGIADPQHLTPYAGGVLCAFGRNLGFVGGSYPDGIVLASVPRRGDSDPDRLRAFGSRLWFTADVEGAGIEPVVTDGTALGTEVLDIVAGTRSGSPTAGAAVSGALVFGADGGLWATDGTAAGTQRISAVTPIDPVIRDPLIEAGANAVFMAPFNGPGRDLWTTDGTAAGTRQLLDLSPNIQDTVLDDAVSIGSRALVSLWPSGGVPELWSTDGTAAGTFRIEPTPGQPIVRPQRLTAAGGRAFFVANAAGGADLWVSDGTDAGTGPVGAYPNGASLQGLVASGNRVFFVDRQAGNLMVSDGTVAGTTVAETGVSQNFTSAGGSGAAGGLFVFGGNATTGIELSFTDGTPGNLRVLRDIAPGRAHGLAGVRLTPVFGGAEVAFVATDLVHGAQIWLSDGTTAGTRRVTQFGSGGAGIAEISAVYSVGTDLYVVADDGRSGMELWQVPGGGGFTLAYGTGCAPPTSPVPALAARGGPPSVGSATFGIDATGVAPGALAFLLIGDSAASGFLPGPCSRLLGFPVVTHAVVMADGMGLARYPLPIPLDPNLAGYSAYLQMASVEPGGPLAGSFSMSHGLQVQFQR